MRAAEVLFESEMLRWDQPPSKRKRQELASHAGRGLGGEAPLGFPWSASGKASGYGAVEECTPTLRSTRNGEAAVCSTNYSEELAGTLTARADSSPGPIQGQNVVAVQGTIANGKRMGQNGLGADESGNSYTLDTMDAHAVCYAIHGNDCLTPWDVQSKRVFPPDACAPTLQSGSGEGMAIPPVVLYAQNQRREIRESGGEGQLAPCIPSQRSGGQMEFVCQPVCVADDNTKAAVDSDGLCGTLKVGGGGSRSLLCEQRRAGRRDALREGLQGSREPVRLRGEGGRDER